MKPSHDYDTNGFAVHTAAVDSSLLDQIRDHLDWLQQHRSDSALSSEYHQFQRANDDAFWFRVLSDDRLLDIAEGYIGPNIALFGSGYFNKAAKVGSRVLWHQDADYWPLEPMIAVTLWLAIDASTPMNGCMKVIPGSHRGQLLPSAPRQDVPNFLGSGIPDAEVDERQAVDVILQPGDLSVHHPMLVHGSAPNASDARRCGLAIRYIPTSTRILSDGLWPGAFLLRGEDRGGVNRYNPRPVYVEGRHMPFEGSGRWKA